MKTLLVTSPALRALLLLELIEHLKAGLFSRILQSGLPAALLDELRQMAIQDIHSLAKMKRIQIRFEIDPDSLIACVQELRAMRARREQVERFVLLGASPQMLRTLFSLSRGDVSHYRSLLGMETEIGRPILPEADIRIDIANAWQQLAGSEPDLRQRYLQLHAMFSEHTLAALAAVLEA